MTFGEKLKELRIKANLTQKDLADQLHVTFQTVSKWENDTNEPDLSTLKELAKVLHCSIEDLLSEEEGKSETGVSADVSCQDVTAQQPVPTTIVQKVMHFLLILGGALLVA